MTRKYVTQIFINISRISIWREGEGWWREEAERGQSHKLTAWSPQGINSILSVLDPGNPDLKVSDLESRPLSLNMHHSGSVWRPLCGQQWACLLRGSGPTSTRLFSDVVLVDWLFTSFWLHTSVWRNVYFSLSLPPIIKAGNWGQSEGENERQNKNIFPRLASWMRSMLSNIAFIYKLSLIRMYTQEFLIIKDTFMYLAPRKIYLYHC